MKTPNTSYLALTATLLIAANPIGQAQAAPEPSAYWTMDAINDVNALFADGHVEWINPLTISPAEYNEKFKWNGANLWPGSGQ